MILTRYLSSEGWVEECSHANAFDAYIDARRRCVLRGCPYLLVDAETGSTVSVLTVKQCLHQYGVCLLYTSPSPRDGLLSRMPSSA